MALELLSAGAAKGLVTALEDGFRAQSGLTVHGTFGAVGAIRETLKAGAPCDVIILTAALLAELAREGSVVAATVAPLGRVRTGVAVRSGDPLPALTDRSALREALVGADAIYIPDPERATAGIHFMKVLRSLGIAEAVGARLQPYPNGAAAMAALGIATEARPIGCTQVTEILYTPGVALAGPLPAEFELSTVYSAAVASRAQAPEAARRLVMLLAGPDARELRERGGFEP